MESNGQVQGTGEGQVQGAPAQGQQAPAMEPALLAGRFKTQADLEKAYTELQSKWTKDAQELAALRKSNPAAQPAPESGAKAEAKGETKAEAAQAKLFDAVYDEYTKSGGQITPETLGSIQAQTGMPPELVSKFVKFMEAESQAGLQQVADHFKDEGTVNIAEVLSGLNGKVTAERANIIHQAILAGEFEILRPYVKAHLKEKAVPAGQVGEVGGAGGGFKSVAERRAAMDDKRFGTDPTFTRAFWQKNAASPEGVRLNEPSRSGN